MYMHSTYMTVRIRDGCPGWLSGKNPPAPGGSAVKSPPANAGDTGDVGLIPASGRAPGGRNGNPLQHSGLESSRDRGWATVHAAAKSWT